MKKMVLSILVENTVGAYSAGFPASFQEEDII